MMTLSEHCLTTAEHLLKLFQSADHRAWPNQGGHQEKPQKSFRLGTISPVITPIQGVLSAHLLLITSATRSAQDTVCPRSILLSHLVKTSCGPWRELFPWKIPTVTSEQSPSQFHGAGASPPPFADLSYSRCEEHHLPRARSEDRESPLPIGSP